MASSGSPISLNAWEICALKYEFPSQSISHPEAEGAASSAWRQLQDPIIYPGLYSHSGLDVVSILLRVSSRPNPRVDLGPIDCSVALILCDLELPDSPIVYVSDAFCELTGYSRREAMGRNCRFLQKPPKGKASATSSSDKAIIKQLRQAVHAREEIQVEVTNYKKDGSRFTNFLSIIPLDIDADGHRYAVGFQVELE